MRLFLDTEFNSYGGELLSIALVADDGRYFYEAVEGTEVANPWVAEHVIPVLRTRPQPRDFVQVLLEQWLAQFDTVHIVADWPEDIAYFSKLLITGPGTRIDTPPLTMEVLRADAPSAQPHNALADARGIREFILAGERDGR